ncbi:MAG: DUF1599 domain-containing protein [Bacteroidales bacterium]
MEENKKVYIRGVKDRGKEIIQKLIDLGGKKSFHNDNGSDENLFYFINFQDEIFGIPTNLFDAKDRTEIFLDEDPKEIRREGWNEAFKKASENGSDENLCESDKAEYTVSYIAEAENKLPENWYISGCDELKSWLEFESLVRKTTFEYNDNLDYTFDGSKWIMGNFRGTNMTPIGFGLWQSVNGREFIMPKDFKDLHPFNRIAKEMFELWQRKNKDYGDSFSKGFEEYGMVMPCIRLEDKLLRLKQLVKNGKAEVKTESIEDTLIDLANYAVMTLMEIRKK